MPHHEPDETNLGSTAVEVLEERLARQRLSESLPSSPAWDAVHAEIEQLEANLLAMDRIANGESR